MTRLRVLKIALLLCVFAAAGYAAIYAATIIVVSAGAKFLSVNVCGVPLFMLVGVLLAGLFAFGVATLMSRLGGFNVRDRKRAQLIFSLVVTLAAIAFAVSVWLHPPMS